jgi:23S rRNA (adenine2503-C2)-methyltransferase
VRAKIQGLTPDGLAELAGIELPDARRIVSLAHRTGVLPTRSPPTIRRAALDRVREVAEIGSLTVASSAASREDPFVKLVVELGDARKIETVRIPLEKTGRFSVCVSSQVGCALACAFCATGRMGLVRNLEAWEIVEQVAIVGRTLPEGARVHSVVFQGMGEPLANADRVIAAIRVLSDPSALAIDQRNITVTTAGVPAGIRRLTREVPHVRLGVSLGDVRPKRRATLMPIDRTNPLDEVLEAAGEHARASGYSPMFAYTLLAGENDGDDACAALADLVLAFGARVGVRPRLSLIPLNPIEGAAFERQSVSALEAFRDGLRARGVPSIVRYSGGADVGAACGQLATASTRQRAS